MKRPRTIFVGTCVLAACLGGSPAPAHEDPVGPAGAIVRTLPLSLDLGAGAAQQRPSAGADCVTLPRATADRPDFESGFQVHVVYLVPSDAPDEQLDVDGTLECSIRAQNQWLAGQSGGLEWRFDTFLMQTSSGTIAVPDITFVRSPQPARNLSGAGGVSAELAARGFDDPKKRYLTYVAAGGGGGTCGDAYYPLPELDQPWSGQYAQVYVDAAPGCGTDVFGVPGSPSLSESVAQQELMHNDGMTPIGAPHSCINGSPPGFAHVCTSAIPIMDLDPERFDVMYPFAGVPLSQKKLDIGHDDYFRHSLPLEDLKNSPFLRHVSERPDVPQGNRPPPEATQEPRPDPTPPPQPTPAPTPAPDPGPSPTPSPPPEPTPTPSPAPEPTEAPADAERSVSLATDKRTVHRGKRVVLSGDVNGEACTSGAEVVIEARRPSQEGFRTMATTSTEADGSFAIRRKIRRTLVFRAVSSPSEGCAGAVSPEVKVRVVRR